MKYLDRLKSEIDELQIKTDKLKDYLSEHENLEGLNYVQVRNLKEQLVFMEGYLNVLNKRYKLDIVLLKDNK